MSQRAVPAGRYIWAAVAGVLSLLVGAGEGRAQVQMPDPSLIHGRAIPAPELPTGTVTVRVVREAIGNNVAGQQVRITVAGASRTASTDAQGRAEFTNLTPAARGHAEANVDGEQLTSEPFDVPASGGLRVILVAGLREAAARRRQEEAAAAAAPPVKGVVVLGSDSRVLMEFRNDALQVFYLLDILNNARSFVDIGGPLIVDLPRGASGAAIMEGSSPTATVSGDRLTVTGPFPPGSTSVQVAFQLRLGSAEVTLEQTWPVAMERVTVAVEKLGNVVLSSPQVGSDFREVRANDGTLFLMTSGPALPAGATLTINLANLPAHGRTPLLVALGLAGVIVAFGGWLAFSGGSNHEAATRRLVERRDALLAELAALDLRHQQTGPGAAGEDQARYARRQQLVAELERIYGELDETSAARQGGGEDIAA